MLPHVCRLKPSGLLMLLEDIRDKPQNFVRLKLREPTLKWAKSPNST